MAVHTLGSRGDLTPNAKIDWVMDKIGLHDRSAHHELFQVMRAIYPQATVKQRQEIIEEVSQFDLPRHDGEDVARTIAYKHFTWFHWLSESDPECGLVKKSVEDIMEQNPEFEPRTWADLTHYSSSGSVRHQTPWSADQLLSKPAKQWAEELLAFRNPDRFEEDRYDRIGLVQAVEEAATRDFPWGIELADTLAEKGRWDTDLWPPLMRAWVHQQREEEQDEVLDRLLRGELHKPHLRTLAETLTRLVNERNLSHGFGLLSKANQIAIMAWDSITEEEPVVPMDDWYSRAINYPAGILAGFWIHSISSWYNEQEPRPAGISEEYLGFMHKIVQDETTAGRLGKSAIARQLRFLTAVDEEWVLEHLVPLFDSENKDDRLAVWEGFLYEGISPGVAEILGAPFLRALASMDELFPQGSSSRELFIRRFAEYITYFVDQPLDPWLPMFFAKADVDDRKRFAWNIEGILRHMETGPQWDLWNRWLRKYWENRLQGTPAPLDPSEAGAMLDWLPHLHDLFPEAAELAIKVPKLKSEHCSVPRQLDSEGVYEHHPEATAKLLVYLATQDLPPWTWHDTKELIENLINGALPEDLDHQLKEILAKLGL